MNIRYKRIIFFRLTSNTITIYVLAVAESCFACWSGLPWTRKLVGGMRRDAVAHEEEYIRESVVGPGPDRV